MILQKQIYLFLALFLQCQLMFSQNSTEILQQHQIVKENTYVDFNTAFTRAKKSVELSVSIKNDSLLLQSYLYLAEALYLQKKNEEVLLTIEKALPIAEKRKDNRTKSSLYRILGSIALRKKNAKKALQYFEEGLQLAKSNKFLKEETELYLSFTILYRSTGDLKNTFFTELASAYNLYGVLFLEKEKDSAVLYYKKGLIMNQVNFMGIKRIIFLI